jgi:RNA-directed DNA polymerase
LSSLLAIIVLSVLDEHVMAPWQPDAEMGTTYRRHGCRQLGKPGGSSVTQTTVRHER